MYYIYFAKSIKNGKIYVGRTAKNPDIRVREHNEGSNKWTKSNGPFRLIYFESYICKDDSIARENFYKTGIGRKVKLGICKVMDD